MNIVYTEFYGRPMLHTAQSEIKHNLIVNARHLNKTVSPGLGHPLYINMLGAEYHNRPFEYFTNMLSKYIKRR